MEELMKSIIYSSIQNFFKNQHDFFYVTAETGMTEWNLTHHLCNELDKYLFWLNSEVDVSKKDYDYRRPDIIFHKRKTNKFNLLVVEAKKSINDKKTDIDKLKTKWMIGNLSYRFGAYINIWDINKFNSSLIVNEFNESYKEIEITPNNCEYISLEKIEEQSKHHIRKVLQEIDKSSQQRELEKPLREKLDNEILQVFSLENRNIR